METISIKDVMVPLSEYATVGKEATLLEAVRELEKAQEDFDHTRYRHRAILVLDESGEAVGKISQLDALRALEPKYEEMFEGQRLSRFGFTPEFMESIMEQYRLLDEPMRDICRKAAQAKVKDFMQSLSEGECVEENISLNKAIHHFVLGHHQSLLVTRSRKIVGVLRLTDVFAIVFHTMKECKI
jgi:CBS-domain-containing membrane protein